MKTLVKTERGVTDLKLMDIEKPVCPDNGVLIKVDTAAICGSDIHYYTDKEPMPVPQIMGHEFCGRIVEKGKDVTGWEVGDFVLSRVPTYPCGECVACRDGHPEKCTSIRIAGLTAPGAYAEYIVSYPDLLYLKPENISPEVGACTEPTTVVYHALKRFGVNPGDTCVVVGLGAIGLLTIKLLKIFGAGEIIAVGRNSALGKKKELALKYGANVFINAQDRKASEQILEYTKGYKVNLAIDCTGTIDAIEDLFGIICYKGTLGALGVPPTGELVKVDWNALVWGSINIITTFGSEKSDYDAVVELFREGKLDFDDMISHKIRLEDWAEIFKNPRNPEYTKAVFKFTE